MAAIAAAGMVASAGWPAAGRLALSGWRPAAVMAWLAGAALMLAAAWTMRQARTTLNPIQPERARQLVRHGLFARSRNPIYLADVVLLLGLLLWLGQVAGLLWIAAFVLWIDRLQIPAEERALARLFGEDYHRYQAQVRRWL